MDYKKIDKDTLKVGDKVVVAYPCYIWLETPFRHLIYRTETITRITPKRTKFITDKREYDRHDNFYEYDERMEEETKLAYAFKYIKDNQHKFGQLAINTMTDEQIKEVAPLFKRIMDIVYQDKKE